MQDFITKYIDLYYLIAFMAVTYSLKNTFHAGLQWLFRHKVNKHFAVFLIGFLVALPFWLYFKHDKLVLVITYAIGTSIHDLIIAYLIKKIKALNSKP